MAISENTKDTLIAVAILGTMFVIGLGDGAALAYDHFTKKESNNFKAAILDRQLQIEQMKKAYDQNVGDVMGRTEENTTDEEA